ncbi:DUF5700 domain-containing putative Zn-dependent protease, partial [Carboxylicivirga marina]|uniref:DUF5700 domain-containing putative Zn-dependent protease n=1 Tax=Carboxylicivirga marina TaxID=2800988 RepID=UPI0025980FA6
VSGYIKKMNYYFKYIALILFVWVGCNHQIKDSLHIQVRNLNVIQHKLELLTVDEIIKGVNETLTNFLPESINLNDTIYLDFIGYSDRGSYANRDSIIIDLSDLDTITYERVNNLIAHETHHILYMKWLLKTVRNTPKDNQQLVQSWWQYRIISEGIAQQINFSDYPKQIQNLYKNEDLLEDLLNFWIENQRSISESTNPKQKFSDIQNYMWSDWSRNKLKEYLPDSEKFSPHRPTVEYYLGYHFYKEIKDNIGNEELLKVIRNPKSLLRTYNSMENKHLSIPEDIIEIWESNYKGNTATNTLV